MWSADRPVNKIHYWKSSRFPERGSSLVARADVAEGTYILCEEPLLTVQHITAEELIESALAATLKFPFNTRVIKE